MASRRFDDLETAKSSLELAPPVSSGEFPVAKVAPASEGDLLLTTEQAGELLGISRFRVNAMIVNGVLAGNRDKGTIGVSRASVEDYIAREAQAYAEGRKAGPQGHFANIFVNFETSDSPEVSQIFGESFTIGEPFAMEEPSTTRVFEFDHEDHAQLEAAKTFVQLLAGFDGRLGLAQILDFQSAKVLCSKLGIIPQPFDAFCPVMEALSQASQREKDASDASAATQPAKRQGKRPAKQQGKRHGRSLLLSLSFIFVLVVLVACAPRQASEEAKSDETTEVILEVPTWSENSDCETCHSVEVESASNQACEYSQHTSIGCPTCHTDDAGVLTKAHENYATASQPTRLKTSEVSQEACESCHDAEERATVAAGLPTLSDSKGTVVNPHALPQTEEHLESVTCADCHKMHSPEPAENNAKKACLSCHHMDVFECGTCH
jgi:hypothetical protein